MKLLRFVLMLSMFLPLSACALSGGPIEGKVLEEGTDKPIPGAIVVARWIGSVPAFAESHTVCVHVESSVTNQEGRYQLPGWSKPSTVGPLVLHLGPVVSAYKPGYGLPMTPSQKEENVYLAPFKGTREDRLNYLIRILGAADCSSAGSGSRSLYRLYEAMYFEAKTLAVTDSDKRIVEIIRKEAAGAWVRTDDTSMRQTEFDRLVDDFLKDHLK